MNPVPGPLVELLELRHLESARAAPRCPEVQKDRLAAEVAQSDGLALWRLQRKLCATFPMRVPCFSPSGTGVSISPSSRGVPEPSPPAETGVALATGGEVVGLCEESPPPPPQAATTSDAAATPRIQVRGVANMRIVCLVLEVDVGQEAEVFVQPNDEVRVDQPSNEHHEDSTPDRNSRQIAVDLLEPRRDPSQRRTRDKEGTLRPAV